MQEEKDLEFIASQLRKPTGEDGINVADNMHINNGETIRRTIDLLDCAPGAKVLEIGYGSGGYASYVIDKAQGVIYRGIDFSETMHELATERNHDLVASGKASFTLGDAAGLPYENNSFDRVFTVNTLYFWEEPEKQLAEILRVLKPGGVFCLAIRSKSVMHGMPFTKYGFNLYEAQEAEKLLTSCGFGIIETVHENEESVKVMGMDIKKDRVIIRVEK